MSNKNKINLEKQIMAKIEKGQIKMKSRLNILAEKLGLGSGLILAGLLLTLILSWLIYWTRANQDLLFITGPYRGVKIFLQTFPYLWVIGFISLFIFLSWLLKKYDFSYKKPLVAILAFIIGLFAAGAYLFQTHPALANYLRQQLPLVYNPKNTEFGFAIGEVIEKTDKKLILNTQNNQQFTVIYNNYTRFPKGEINIGDTVRAVGQISKQQVQAQVIMNLSLKQQLFKITPMKNRPRLRQQFRPGFNPTMVAPTVLPSSKTPEQNGPETKPQPKYQYRQQIKPNN